MEFVIRSARAPLKQKHLYIVRQLCFLVHTKDLVRTGGLAETGHGYLMSHFSLWKPLDWGPTADLCVPGLTL